MFSGIEEDTLAIFEFQRSFHIQIFMVLIILREWEMLKISFKTWHEFVSR